MNSTTQDPQASPGVPPDPYAEARPIAFCQNCGRPLSKETARVVGPAVYCEPCLAARLGGATAGPTSAPISGAAYTKTPPFPWASPSAQPNPNLAALLGLIPGVGAMYNEQYAKGIAHLFIFALLVSLSHMSEIFGLLLSGWIFYMAIEAHHTARARRDGTPLPNPFGLNDIGERLGFDANLRRAHESVAQPPRQTQSQSSTQTPPYTPPYVPPTSTEDATPFRAPEPVATWGAPVDTPAYATNPGHFPPFVPDSASAAYTQPWPPAQPTGSPSAAPPYGPHIDAPPLPIVPASRFPAAAVGLMMLGSVFLLGTTGIFHNVSGHVLLGFGLIGLAAWVFTRRFTCATRFDASNYRARTIHALTPSAWLALIGTLILLDALGLMRWSYSWPWIIIATGVLLLLKRSVPGTVATSPIAPIPPVPPLATDFSQPPGPRAWDGRE